jgi:hypothetical protein
MSGIAAASPGSALALAGPCTSGNTSWTNPSGGLFSDYTNWSNGTPSPSCSADITLAGTYTVVTDGGDSAGLTVGGSSGTQTLQLVGTTVSGSPQDASLNPGYSGGVFTIGAHGVLQMTSSGSNPGATFLGGSVVSSGLITVDAGSPGPNTRRDLRANVTNNAGGVIAFHTDVVSCGCGSGGTWINNGTFTTDPGTTTFLSRSGAGIDFTLAGGTFASNGRTIIDGSMTHTGGVTTGNPIQVCGNVDAHDPSTASFEIIYDTAYCGGGAITGDIGAGDTVLVNNTDPSAQLLVSGGSYTNNGTLTLEGAPSDKYLIGGGQITNVGTLNMLGAGRSEIQKSIVNTGTVNVGAGETLSMNGNFTQSGGALKIAGTFDALHFMTEPGGTNTVDGTLNLTANLPITGGTLQGIGTIVAPGGVTNTSGIVHPGHSPGILSITGDYAQSAGGTLAVDVAGTAPGTGYSQLAVSGNASIAGALAVTTPLAQTGTFRVLTANALTGTFSPVTFTGQTDSVLYDGVSVQLSGTAPPTTSPPTTSPPPTSPPPGGTVPPVPAPSAALAVSQVHLASRAFTAAAGTNLAIDLSEPATVTVTVAQRVSGRVVRGRCSTRAKRGHPCTRSHVVRTLTFTAVKGRNVLRLRLAGLHPGSYTATVSVRDSAGHHSRTFTLSFSVKKARHH